MVEMPIPMIIGLTIGATAFIACVFTIAFVDAIMGIRQYIKSRKENNSNG